MPRNPGPPAFRFRVTIPGGSPLYEYLSQMSEDARGRVVIALAERGLNANNEDVLRAIRELAEKVEHLAAAADWDPDP